MTILFMISFVIFFIMNISDITSAFSAWSPWSPHTPNQPTSNDEPPPLLRYTFCSFTRVNPGPGDYAVLARAERLGASITYERIFDDSGKERWFGFVGFQGLPVGDVIRLFPNFNLTPSESELNEVRRNLFE